MAALQTEGALPELSDWYSKAESGFQMWLAGRDASAVNLLYYDLGRIGASRGVPLTELIEALMSVIRLARAEDFPVFCHDAKYYVARGYEDARR